AGPFVIRQRIGEGPTGIVYGASYAGRDVVLKVLRRDAARDRRALHRFLTVSRMIGRVGHPALPKNLVAGHLAEIGAYYLAYDDSAGEPLSARIRRDGPMHFQEARLLLRGVLDGLSALHERGLSHGNLKLENIIVSRASGGAAGVLVVDG